MILRKKLWLVGDDDVLDALADLSRHLDYFQVARVEELPDPPLDADDHVVIAMVDEARSRELRGRVHIAGSPGQVIIVPTLPGKSTGARAIVAAAALVAFF